MVAVAIKGRRLHTPDLGEFQRSVVIANGFLLLPPGLAAKFEGLIINKASAAEGSGELSGLHIRGEESILETLLD